ncbi:MAG: MFS transporter [Erythrobacter sp.]
MAGETADLSSGSGAPIEGVKPESRAYRYYVLVLLTIAAMFSIADRLVLSILLEDIKAEFMLSDTQLGLLTGLAFALFYVLAGFPIARLADRSNRKNIVAASLAFYSAMTALCGAATGFWTLFLARMGVGIGEGGSGPPATSILADYFKRTELARAMSFHTLGAVLGTGGGLIAGGLLAAAFGWRMAFVLLGLPGIVLGLVVYFTMREPPRGRYAPKGQNKPQGKLLESLTSFLKNKVLMLTCMGWALATTIGYAMAIWLAPIMLRNFEMDTANVGLILGLTFIAGGIPGPILGGILTDWLAKFDVRWRAWIPAFGTLACLPLYYLCLTAGTLTAFLGFFVVGYLFFLFQNGPSIAIIQTSTGAGERALAFAFALLINNIAGQAIGPFVIGVVSDSLAPAYGTESLNMAVLGTVFFAGALAFIFFIWAGVEIKKQEADFTD